MLHLGRLANNSLPPFREYTTHHSWLILLLFCLVRQLGVDDTRHGLTERVRVS